MSAEISVAKVDEINRRHERILNYGRKALDEAVILGGALADVKESLPHGTWLPWVSANLRFTARTAQRYTLIWDNRERLKTENISDLSEAYSLLSEPKQSSTTHLSHLPEPATKATREVIIDAELVEPDPKVDPIMPDVPESATTGEDSKYDWQRERIKMLGDMRDRVAEFVKSLDFDNMMNIDRGFALMVVKANIDHHLNRYWQDPRMVDHKLKSMWDSLGKINGDEEEAA